MPRPLVEVRQTVLNPVVTINDPQQEVCIVGLHTEDYTDQQVHEVDLPSSAAAGAAIHQAAGAQVEFTLDVNGVFLDANIDFGPEDNYDVSDNQEIKFSEAWYSEKEVVNAYNTADDMSDHSPDITLAANIGLSSLGGEGVKLLAQPAATHYNKLVYASGDAVDFSTHADFENIVQGSEIKFTTANGAGAFIVLSKYSGGLYLRGKAAADHAKLLTGNEHFAITDSADAAIAADSRFSLVHAGVHEVQVNHITADAVAGEYYIKCAGALPFAVRASDNADFVGAMLVQVDEDDLADLTTDESANLTVANTGTGDAEITLSAAGMTYNAKAVVRAKLTMSYTVARTDLSAGLTRVDQNTYSAVLGGSTPRNPLALAAELALLNSGSSSVNVLALDLTPISGETEPKSVETAFTDALSIVNRHATTYAMVPLTTNPTITKTYANAAEALSVPRKGQFRICIGSSKGAPQADFIIGSPSSPAKFGLTTDDDAAAFKSKVTNSAGDFYRLPSGKVLTGDVITAQDAAGNTYIGEVTDATNTELLVTWDDEANYPANATELTSYYVSRSLLPSTKIDRQIEILTAEANAIASKRLFLTFPGACTVVSGDSEFVGVPSYYVSAAFSGLMARLEIHRPKNFLGLAGVSGLQDFSRFSDDQLDQISDAGYLVFQQEEATSAPFCVHQINTYHGVAAGTQEYTELSVIANFDFVSRYLKEVLDPFAGTVNIVPSTFGIINASLDAAMDNLSSRRVATIGAPLLSGSVEYVRQASYDSGTLEASVLVSLPKVLNKIILEVVSG